MRELDERFGLGEWIEQHRTDSRRGKKRDFRSPTCLQLSVSSQLITKISTRRRSFPRTPTFRFIGSEKIWDRGRALIAQWQAFETDRLAEGENCAGLGRLNRALIGKWETTDEGYRTVLDRGFDRDPSVRRARAERLQRVLRVHLFSSSAAVQSTRVIVWPPSCGLATCTAPKAGKSSCWRRSNGSNEWERRLRSGVTRPLPSPKSTRRWKRGA